MDCWRPDDVPCEEHFTNSPDCVWAICQHIKKELDNNIPFNWDNEAQWPNSKNMCDIRFKTFKNWWPHDGKKGWAVTSKKVSKFILVYLFIIYYYYYYFIISNAFLKMLDGESWILFCPNLYFRR
jgi:hypothetical protein